MPRPALAIALMVLLPGCSLLGRFGGEAPPRDVREVVLTVKVEQSGALPAGATWSSVQLRSIGGDLAPVAERALRERLVPPGDGPPLRLTLVLERTDRRAPARPGSPPYYAFDLALHVQLGQRRATIRSAGETRADPAGLVIGLARQLADRVRDRQRSVTIALLSDGSAPVTSAIERARAGRLADARALLQAASRAAIHDRDVPAYDLAALAEAGGDMNDARGRYLEAWERAPDDDSRERCLTALARVRRLPSTRLESGP